MKSQIKEVLQVFRSCRRLSDDPNDQSRLDKQIEALKCIQKSLDEFGSMRYQISSFEKLLCDPWMNDQSAFDQVYSAWDSFRNSFKRYVGGMTVNERLCYFGLMDDYDQSVGRPLEMRSVLLAVFLSESNIDAIIRA
ncbi:hypothetical protein HW115_18680 [Verrucomicrobiaceae bacterium N1E253]|uniref:Uncharacterized protein n=1 Tax=Oceaniferula marina TaxID=2748318 RepID=A0A851GS95_9BACT|nr:hypothetical protein [Oceaniferula marina]NWK57650.1 hypothetical protein [Oceaniferula marina]